MASERYSIWVNGREVVSYSDHIRARKEAQRLSKEKRSVVLSDNGTTGAPPKTIAQWQDGGRV